MTFTVARSWVLVLAGTAVGALSLVSGCVSEDGTPAATGGSAGAGTGGSGVSGSTSTTGGSGGGSTTGGASGTADPLALPCPAPKAALVTDFSMPADATNMGASWGDGTTVYSGSTFYYPGADQPFPLTSDVSKGNWHVTGMVGAYSGLGIANYVLVTNPTTMMLEGTACTKIDLSAYKGISFTISGSVPGSTGTSNSVTFWLGIAGNDITSAWKNSHKQNATDADVHNFGRCTPVGTTPAAQYDGTCKNFEKAIPVTATPTPITVLWGDLTGGQPVTKVDATEVVGFGWGLPAPAGVDTATPMTYALDLTIDDLKFVE